MPNDEQNIKHSFSESYRPGEDPQGVLEPEAGYLSHEPTYRYGKRLTLSQLDRSRARRLKKQREYNKAHYQRKKKAAKAKEVKHPSLSKEMASAVDEAASLA